MDIQQALNAVFGVVVRGRSYLNAAYLLLAFPLGIAYFCFLVTGWSLGFGLLIIWIGLIVLAAVLLMSFGFSAFERQQAILLLGTDIEPMWQAPRNGDFWPNVKAFLTNKVTWTGMLFLFLKFPLGVASFVLTITMGALSGAFLLAPLYYRFEPPNLYWWYIDTLPEALLLSLIGALWLIATLHVINGLAWVWSWLAKVLLGGSMPSFRSAEA